MTLAYVFYLTLRVVMVGTLIISLFYCYRSFNPAYLCLFPIYHLIACVTEILVDTYFSSYTCFSTATNIPYNLFTSLEFIFFSFFILRRITKKSYKLVALTCASITIMVILFLIIKYHTLDYSNLIFTIPLNTFYFTVCLIYFLNFFSNSKYSNPSRDPSFWIASGILLYSVIVMPTMVFTVGETEVARCLYVAINSIGYLFLNLLFIKAYVCKIHK